MLDRERGQRAAELFAEALEHLPAARADFLCRACGEDGALHDSVLALLEIDAAGRGPLEGLGSPSGKLSGPAEMPTAEGAPRPLLAPGQVLGRRYRIARRLGSGGMGEVWQAFDLRLRVDVALKSIRRDRFRDTEALELLRREILAARNVASPNVCRLFDLVEVDGHELVSMEYIDGTTLLGILHERGPLELRQATEIASQFLAGLEAIHEARLVHRDVKPENIMVTRAGRVVLMDFGLAKSAAEGGTIAGTPAYMAPEQLRGDNVDARADIFAAGITLAEMIAIEGIRDPGSRESVQSGVRADPPHLPDSPWRPVLRRAVSRTREDRYPTARELIRALEEVTSWLEPVKDLRPYPGLAPFGEADAEYFFGREIEVEAVWKKLPEFHLAGLIGPSGAGKSSFLHAGLIPARPPGWRCAICHPGDRPLVAMARALLPELADDPEAEKSLARFASADAAVEIFTRWRRQHREVLLILDQFEELFTLNPTEEQARTADILSRLALEADVHVLLSMRDDFLFHCHAYPALAPLFSQLTPLGPPTGAALRRALVQPALLCGCRFEDDALADQMLAEVSNERGALPLLAFAIAQLWSRRDRERGLLTRAAHQRIGGVGGALAQHAERTLEQIDPSQLPVVRELFRNLITAQGTRAAREVENLLSVFAEDERAAALGVLRVLIDARLLTSFERMVEEDEDEDPTHRVEIIHESLLTAWPRLVRWQTQDADSAQFRDQVRQAAQLWEERGRPQELLWSGSAFREFRLWREHYPGGLTDTEVTFGRAMEAHATRRRRRRRVFATAAFAVLLIILAVVGSLWRNAVVESERAEAARLLTEGQAMLERDRTEAVALILASLELTDSPDARRAAVEALWAGPTYVVPPEEWALETGSGHTAFSPDGNWLAIAARYDVRLYRQRGGAPIVLETPDSVRAHDDRISQVHFGPDSDRLFAMAGHRLLVWSIPQGGLIQAVALPFEFDFFAGSSREGFPLTVTKQDGHRVLHAWPTDGSDPIELGRRAHSDPWTYVQTDPTGRWIAYASGTDLFTLPIDGFSDAEPHLVGNHSDTVICVDFDSGEGRLLSVTETGETRVWSIADGSIEPVHVIAGEAISRAKLDRRGKIMATFKGRGAYRHWGEVRLWDLDGPPTVDPVLLGGSISTELLFEPSSRCLVTRSSPIGSGGAAFKRVLWLLGRPGVRILRGHNADVHDLVFTPDGRWLVSVSADASVRRWPMAGEDRGKGSILYRHTAGYHDMAADPLGRFVAAATDNAVHIIPLDGGAVREFQFPEPWIFGVDVSPDGRFFAMGAIAGQFIRVVNIETGEARVVDESDPGGIVWDVHFTRDGHVLSSGRRGLHMWNLQDGSRRVLLDNDAAEGNEWSILRAVVTPDGRYVLAAAGVELDFLIRYDGVLLYDLENDTWRRTTSYGTTVGSNALAIDRSGRTVVTGDLDGVVRVGPVTGEEPHLLVRHNAIVRAVAISPDGRWVASGDAEGIIRLWPMPGGQPLHTRSYEEVRARVRALTNVRAVRDVTVAAGYRFEVDEFPGWETTSHW